DYATPTGQRIVSAGAGGSQSFTPTASHTVSVPMHASVTVGVIVLAVLLAVAGGLLAGTFGSWRIGRLRPAAALARGGGSGVGAAGAGGVKRDQRGAAVPTPT